MTGLLGDLAVDLPLPQLAELMRRVEALPVAELQTETVGLLSLVTSAHPILVSVVVFFVR